MREETGNDVAEGLETGSNHIQQPFLLRTCCRCKKVKQPFAVLFHATRLISANVDSVGSIWHRFGGDLAFKYNLPCLDCYLYPRILFRFFINFGIKHWSNLIKTSCKMRDSWQIMSENMWIKKKAMVRLKTWMWSEFWNSKGKIWHSRTNDVWRDLLQ